MKRLIFLLLCLCFMCINITAAEEQSIIEPAQTTTKAQRKSVAKDNYLSGLLDKRNECIKNKDFAGSINLLEQIYHEDKSYLGAQDEAKANLQVLEQLTTECYNKYELSKDKTYLHKSYKYAKLAYKNGTKNTDVILGLIYFHYQFLKENKMMEVYEYLYRLDSKIAEEYKEKIDLSYQQIKECKRIQKEQRNQNFYQAAVGAAMGSNAGYNSNKPRYTNTTVTPIGNTYFINSYSY